MLVMGLALACVALYFVTGGRAGSGSSSSSASPTATATAPGEATAGAPEVAAKHFLDTYVKSNGRVSRTDQGNDTVGEGQAYGMLLAAAIGDEKRFDLIWDWTKRTCAAATGSSPSSGRTARSSTPSRRPTPTWMRRARCSRRRAASTALNCVTRGSSSARRF